MTDSPRPGSPSDPTPYQGYSDPAYAGNAPYGPSYTAASVPGTPAPTEALPQYWTQTYPHTGPVPSAGDRPPEPPRGPRPWLWAAGGFAIAVVIGLVLWLVFVITNPSTQETAIPGTSEIPTTTPTRTTMRSPTPPIMPIPLPTLTLPTGPSTPSSGETEPVVYEVTGQGRAISIAYNDTGGVMQTEFNVLLPWHKEVNLPKPAEDSASIMVINAGRDITCRISIAGVAIRERSGAVLTVCSPTG
jgi:Mycobacterium membrane protein